MGLKPDLASCIYNENLNDLCSHRNLTICCALIRSNPSLVIRTWGTTTEDNGSTIARRTG